MARLTKADLFDRVLTALDESGWAYLVESAQHPFLLRLFDGDRALRVRIYVWRVTHGGGGARAHDEYRIQITSGVHEFNTNGVDRTLILGWWEDAGVFAGWDPSKHRGHLGASPSFQIVEGALRNALIAGMATQTKGNDEIAVAVKPSFLGQYIAGQPQIHGLAGTAGDVHALNEILANPTQAESAIETGSTEGRRVVLGQVARKVRAANFADRIRRAYNDRCAMCGVQTPFGRRRAHHPGRRC